MYTSHVECILFMRGWWPRASILDLCPFSYNAIVWLNIVSLEPACTILLRWGPVIQPQKTYEYQSSVAWEEASPSLLGSAGGNDVNRADIVYTALNHLIIQKYRRLPNIDRLHSRWAAQHLSAMVSVVPVVTAIHRSFKSAWRMRHQSDTIVSSYTKDILRNIQQT